MNFGGLEPKKVECVSKKKKKNDSLFFFFIGEKSLMFPSQYVRKVEGQQQLKEKGKQKDEAEEEIPVAMSFVFLFFIHFFLDTYF